jgi:hypothetical protein
MSFRMYLCPNGQKRIQMGKNELSGLLVKSAKRRISTVQLMTIGLWIFPLVKSASYQECSYDIQQQRIGNGQNHPDSWWRNSSTY